MIEPEVGDRVIINSPIYVSRGTRGTIISIDNGNLFKYKIKDDVGLVASGYNRNEFTVIQNPFKLWE